jgi:positive regulator of sigma E activity
VKKIRCRDCNKVVLLVEGKAKLHKDAALLCKKCYEKATCISVIMSMLGGSKWVISQLQLAEE